MTEPLKINERFRRILGFLQQLREEIDASGIIVFPEAPLDWARLRRLVPNIQLLVASTSRDMVYTATEHGFSAIYLEFERGTPIYDRMSQAVLEAVADDLIPHGGRVIALYSAFDPQNLDSISVINLGEHLDRLSGRDLRQLESRVPLRTLKIVVDMAVEIGMDGREGKSVGTLFVVGDTRKVLEQSRPFGFDPMRGYHRKERSIFDAKVREGVKEIAQLDGAIIIAADGTVEAAARYLESASTATISLSLGLGARHWAAAAISRATSAVAITVSQSCGTVRIFQNGEVALRIESRHQHPLVWRELEAAMDDPRR